MPTEKRQRQKENRAARLEAEAKAAARARRTRAIRNVVIVVVVVFGAAFLLSLLGGDDEPDVTTTLATTTSVAPSTTTSSTTPEEAPQASNYELFASQPTACGAEQPPAPTGLSFAEPGDEGIDSRATVTATITTSCGVFTLDLDPEAAPIAVNSFVFLARQGFFDGIPIHRVSPGFVIQTGDPEGSGFGGPGYTFEDELPPADTTYDEGVLAMANSGPDTNGSQFFVTVADVSLPPNFTIFGSLAEGRETLEEVLAVPLGANAGGEFSRPLESIYIESVEISVS